LHYFDSAETINIPIMAGVGGIDLLK